MGVQTKPAINMCFRIHYKEIYNSINTSHIRDKENKWKYSLDQSIRIHPPNLYVNCRYCMNCNIV